MSTEEPRLPDYLDHIVEALRRIRSYSAGLTETQFALDTMVQDGVIRNIEVIGEAADNIQRTSADFARQHPEVPWALVYAMRNRLAHGYFKVDLEIVWRTIQNDFPDLEQRIRLIRDKL